MNRLLQHRKEQEQRLRAKALKEAGGKAAKQAPKEKSKAPEKNDNVTWEEEEPEDQVDNTSTVEEENITVEGSEDNVSKLVSQWMNDALNIGDDEEDDEDDEDNNSTGLSLRSIEEYTHDSKSDGIEEDERIAGVGLGAERKPKNVTKAQERLEEKLRRDKAANKRATKESGGALAAPASFDSSDSRSSVLGKRLKKKGINSIAKVDKLLKRDKKKKKEAKKATKAEEKKAEETKKVEEVVEKKVVEEVKKDEVEKKEKKEDEVMAGEEKEKEKEESGALPDFIGVKRKREFNRDGKDRFDSPQKKRKRTKTRSKQKNIKKDHRPPELRPGGRPQQPAPSNEGENKEQE